MKHDLGKIILLLAVIIFCSCGTTNGTYENIDPNHITGEQLQRTGQSSVLGALQGLVPGLNVVRSGRNDYDANIRGIDSMMSPTTPLYIIDGVIVDSFDSLNIYDIDYVDIMKDASIYGSRGANGAIYVHTKRGPAKEKKGGVSVEYNFGTTIR